MKIIKDFIVFPSEFNALVESHFKFKEKTEKEIYTIKIINEEIIDNIVPDLSNKFIEYTLIGDSIIKSPINLVKGSQGIINIKQDDVGGHNLVIDYDNFFSPAGEILMGLNPHDEIVIDFLVMSEERTLLVLKSNYNLGA